MDFSQVLEAGSQISIPTQLGSAKSSLPACRLPVSYGVLTWRRAEQRKTFSGNSDENSAEGVNPSQEGSTLVTSSNPVCLPKAPVPNTITLRDRVSTYEFGEDRKLQFIDPPMYIYINGAWFCHGLNFMSVEPLLYSTGICFSYSLQIRWLISPQVWILLHEPILIHSAITDIRLFLEVSFSNIMKVTIMNFLLFFYVLSDVGLQEFFWAISSTWVA